MAIKTRQVVHSDLFPAPLAGTASWLRRRFRTLVTAGVTVMVTATAVLADEPPKTDSPAHNGDDLGKRLIRKARTGVDEDVMAVVVRSMDTAAHRLTVDFDVGEETQAVQSSIVEKLNEAIELAAAQQSRRSQNRTTSKGDKRRLSEDGDSGDEKNRPEQQDSSDAAGSGLGGPGGAPVSADVSDGPLSESRRSWGNLPQRERDEMIQGADERYLGRFREWIEQYYRTLQEADE